MQGAESGEFEARIIQACGDMCLPACRGQREAGILVFEGTAAQPDRAVSVRIHALAHYEGRVTPRPVT